MVADHAAWLAAGIASDGSRRTTGARHDVKPCPLSERPAGEINFTHPDARTLGTFDGRRGGLEAGSAVGVDGGSG